MGTVEAKVARAGVNVILAKRLARMPFIVHGFSTRTGGFSKVYGGKALNLGFTKHDQRKIVEQNRALFLRTLGASNGRDFWPLVTVRQIHSDIVHCVSSSSSSAALLAGDGLITQTPGLALAVLTADCLPVILVDPRTHTVGVFHAGWRGTVRRIVEKGVGEMRKQFGCKPRDIHAAIGPGIGRCCYQVGEEVRTKFETQFAYAGDLFREVKESDPIREKYPLLFLTRRAPGHSELPTNIFLDLVEANRRQLMDAGLPPKNIEAVQICTACRPDLLFSHRVEKGVTGRMMAVVGIKPKKSKS
jgi:YfiH family protein